MKKEVYKKGATKMTPICLKDTGKYGRGIFATRDIKTGEMIEISPVLLLRKDDWKYVKKTLLHDYCFFWGENDELTVVALGYGSLYNHSYTPNATFTNNMDNLTIDFEAIMDIKGGEEITINYNGSPDDLSSLWFDVR